MEPVDHATYTGNERRKVNIEQIQKEAAERAKLEFTLDTMQKTLVEQGQLIKDLTASNSAHFSAIEEKLETYRREREEASRLEGEATRHKIAMLQERLDPIEKDFLAREKAKLDDEKAAKDRIEHGKKVAIGTVVTGVLVFIGGFSLWLFNLWQAKQ